MPCGDAMITEVISARPDQTIAEVLDLFDTHHIRAVPVLDEGRRVVGKISFTEVLQAVLPVPVTLEGGLRRLPSMDISLAYISGASPWVAKRLHEIVSRKVSSLMVKKPKTVHSDTPSREGVRLLVKYGSPLIVVDPKDGTLTGLITSQTAIKRFLELEHAITEQEKQQKSA
ncbi:MAG TPA: hypothetical protein DDX54_01230 [Rhodospirillaceae bacterium]|jgi:CBS domain-containing membrane protein|nr:CBS domain-containing protein [Alphaproteobacteria bacterium]HBH26017.1 hypothetical protein [Rhodospirillaceae bacterium]